MLAALVAGCGGDDEPSAETRSAPELTVPETDTEETQTTAPPPVTTAEPAPPPATDGGTPAPETEPPDSPENDTPPPADSPAERFEKFCDDNPGACG